MRITSCSNISRRGILAGTSKRSPRPWRRSICTTDGSFHLGNPPQWRSDDLFALNVDDDRRALFASTAKPDFEDFYSYYSLGWLMNHYLTFEPTRRGQLQTYLKLVDEGVPSGDAARKAFGDLDRLAAEIMPLQEQGPALWRRCAAGELYCAQA